MQTRLDAIIFGATGVTGKYVVRHAVELFADLTWGIAGRNKSKLEALLRDVGAKVHKNLDHIPIIMADANDEISIQAMAAKCKIVLNCCGPYQLYGEVVVKSCIEAGTHHVDVTGEPKFIADMQLQYNDLAQQKGVYVISACGFECVPAEMGVGFVQELFPGTVNSIEMFVEVQLGKIEGNRKAIVSSTSWETLLYILSHPMEMVEVQKKLDEMMGTNVPLVNSPKLRVKPYIQKPAYPNSYFLPFYATDFFVVKQSQRVRQSLEGKVPAQFQSYIGYSSFLVALVLPLTWLFYLVMAMFRCTRNFLIKHPSAFTMGFSSFEGPTDEAAEALTFKMTFKAVGWSRDQPLTTKPETTMLAQLTGRNNYAVTAVCLLYCARLILDQKDKMPQRGGVLPPGAAFLRTNLREKLSQHKYGVKYEVLG